jgi:hypothetical protein
MFAVAATSATDAWAVGDLSSGHIVHWDGSRWRSVPAVIPPHTSMRAVAASSPGNAWALGEAYRPNSTWQDPVMMHWDGRAWRQVPLPVPPGTFLSSVTVTSPANAWAVGSRPSASRPALAGQVPIAVHWDGSTWQPVPLPGLPFGGGVVLDGVSATSASDAWAVGSYSDRKQGDGFVLHWNGSSWSLVPSAPVGAAGPFVAATATGYTWLLGAVMAALWNGHHWTTIPVPLVGNHNGNRGGNTFALAASGYTAWVAGNYCTTQCGTSTLPLLLRWNGGGWQRTPVPYSDINIFGLAVTSPTNAWAVGTKAPRTTIILHWNGSKWT